MLGVAYGACDSCGKSLVDKPSEMIFGYRTATNPTGIEDNNNNNNNNNNLMMGVTPPLLLLQKLTPPP